MNILILGGTGFIGSAMAWAFAAAGHSVTVFSRGQTAHNLPASTEQLIGHRDSAQGLQALAGRTWDTCIDASGYLPQQVRLSGELLQNAASHYIFVSAVAAYGDSPGPLTEQSATPRLGKSEQAAVQSMDDLDNRTYGPSKVACEDTLRGLFAERLTVLRPQVVTGSHDPTGRFGVWPARAAARECLVLPGDGSDFLQVIDVRDVAAFTVKVAEQRLIGTFNLAGPRLTWAEFARLLGSHCPAWVPVPELEVRGIPLSTFPLFRPTGSERSAWMNVNSEAARRLGLTFTPLEQTLQVTYQTLSPEEGARLSAISEAEAALLL